MGKKKSNTPSETFLVLPTPPTTAPIIDTHTHLVSTFESYRQRYKDNKHETIFDLLRGIYAGRNVESIVDVWCEAPVRKLWKEFADSALKPEDRHGKWGGIDYWFVMGVHPHEARHYTDEIENEIIEAMSHPRCVGWGEMGLDYHYDNSPRDIQRSVFRRQVKHAVRLGKPLTIHTREADEDTEVILKEEAPRDHKIHIHCFTDTPAFAQRLLEHFPNLYIGITGVITYTTNPNTSAVISHLSKTYPSKPLRILLETDAPYMVPANLYNSIPELKGKKLPLCHTAMIPWTAEFVAQTVREAGGTLEDGNARGNTEDDHASGWDAERVMRDAREGARVVYGI
ncbi:hypothetical protein P691DRAFT_777998 [Macrolepiota fuliginosa MF-IS2]|uniref:Metallo-dependent hydrolase n=1 Tax=Macrolepiota fuliginosa MF-IS2 TaxID=1400762 RepID=A0A9P5X7K1_9AGAR|nr:hypothetical protein P691DRAFT_777998 [Macrolepiota fuliginosa MF-IS2]